MAAKEATDYIQAHATQGDPESVIKTADTYSTTIKGNMNVGNKKGAAIDEIIKEHKPKIVIELGGFFGYSAIRFGTLIRSLDPSAHYYSFEVDPIHVALMRQNIAKAGLEDAITVIEGAFSEQGKDFLQKYNLPSVDMVFIDHWKDLYVPDLKRLEEWRYFHEGTVIAADNILYPGAPEYAEYVRGATDKYDTRLIKAQIQFGAEAIEDGVEVSVWKLKQ